MLWRTTLPTAVNSPGNSRHYRAQHRVNAVEMLYKCVVVELRATERLPCAWLAFPKTLATAGIQRQEGTCRAQH